MIKHTESINSNICPVLDHVQIQPNAFDVYLTELFSFSDSFEISEEHKKHRKLTPVKVDMFGNFVLLPHTSYQFETNTSVKMSYDEAGWLVTRSTLNRNGIFVKSGLYDSGYIGGIGGCIFNSTDNIALIKQGTRVAQFVVVAASSSHLYNGSYNEV